MTDPRSLRGVLTSFRDIAAVTFGVMLAIRPALAQPPTGAQTAAVVPAFPKTVAAVATPS